MIHTNTYQRITACSNALTIPKEYLYDAKKVLLRGSWGLLHGVTPLGASILEHVTLRTLGFGKVFESINWEDLQFGVLALAVPGTGVSRWTLKTECNKLAASGLLLRWPVGKTNLHLFCINLVGVLRKLKERLVGVQLTALSAKHLLDKTVELLERLLPFEDIFVALGKLKVVTDLGVFEMDITELMKDRQQRQDKRTQDRQAKRRERESVTSSVVMTEWLEAVQAAGFPLDGQKNTNALRGKLKNWVAEQSKLGSSSTAILDKVRGLVERWEVIRGLELSTGKGAKVTVPYTPDLEFYYNNRTQIDAWLWKESKRAETREAGGDGSGMVLM